MIWRISRLVFFVAAFVSFLYYLGGHMISIIQEGGSIIELLVELVFFLVIGAYFIRWIKKNIFITQQVVDKTED